MTSLDSILHNEQEIISGSICAFFIARFTVQGTMSDCAHSSQSENRDTDLATTKASSTKRESLPLFRRATCSSQHLVTGSERNETLGTEGTLCPRLCALTKETIHLLLFH